MPPPLSTSAGSTGSTSPAGYSLASKRSSTRNGRSPGDDDVQATVVEALGHLGDAGLAADSPGAALVVAKDDPERLLLLETARDHALVALLENVQRQQLARQQDQRKLEDRELDSLVRHDGSLSNAERHARQQSAGLNVHNVQGGRQ